MLDRILKHRAGLAGVIALSIGLLFQNCAPPVAEEDLSTASVDTTPFAFDIKMDTIAHMSCTQANDAVFTLKTGAYLGGSGIRLSSAFLDYIGGDRPTHVLEKLQASTNNAIAQPQAAVRNATGSNPYLQLLAVGSANSYEILGPLGADEYAAALAQSQDTYIRHFESVPALFDRNIEFQMHSMGDLGAMIGLRTHFEQGGVLTVSFVDYQNTATPPLAPDAEDAGFSAYGRAYQLGFDSDSNFPDTQRRRLVSVTSKSMIDLSTIEGEDFGCISYRIIRKADWEENPELCPVGTDPEPSDSGITQHEFVRRVLDPSSTHWYIHTRDSATAATNYPNCIVPKAAVDTCYGTGTQTIEYGGVTACDDTDADSSNNCPHYLSICSLGIQ
tara:strand:+ start:248612 stop:249772 length:1161 start_codon:yes stop_codon:yes gene_type:complete